MTTTPTFAMPEREPVYRGVGNWKVLARLPDVTDFLPTTAQQPHRSAGKGTIDYRFDPPERPSAELRPERDIATEATQKRPQLAAAQHPHGPPQPHLFQRASRTDYPAQAPRRESRILPRSNPFSIPASSLQDTLAPVVRFLMLVALFTAAGTTILAIGKRSGTAPEEPIGPTTAIRQSLEPAAPTDSATLPLDDAFAVPTVTVPPGAEDAPDSATPPDATATARANASSPRPQANDNEPHATRDTNDAPIDSGMPAFDLPLPPLTGADGGALPQVRTSEPPAAVARLQGLIQEIPTRQAKNDDDEPSLY